MEAFVPLVLDVQERVMDVANVEITDFADFYFLAGFFASVLTDIPVKEYKTIPHTIEHLHCIVVFIRSRLLFLFLS